MTTHTKGPWRVQPLPPNCGGCRTIQANKAGDHKQAQWRTDICNTVGLHNDTEDKANAYLIATAPMQHDALVDLVALVKRIVPDANMLHEIHNADEAIRKAKEK